jgi:hypothetical protein
MKMKKPGESSKEATWLAAHKLHYLPERKFISARGERKHVPRRSARKRIIPARRQRIKPKARSAHLRLRRSTGAALAPHALKRKRGKASSGCLAA